jgi:hypothetical protein
MACLLFLEGCLTSWFKGRVSETIYAQGFLILDAGIASFRMSRSRVLLCERDRPRLALVTACDLQHHPASMPLTRKSNRKRTLSDTMIISLY